ncbi:hypothetical protein N431DRAFT_474790 [Stipitochalara longipes BDJ]|nr:hypothetical protein N431DRAFT_474790 [Stipitochalara longipes BDJ]
MDNGEPTNSDLRTSTVATPKTTSKATLKTKSTASKTKHRELKAKSRTSIAKATPPPCFITKISNEILFQIVDELHPVESTCLGLTYKAFYALHKVKNPKVELWYHVPVNDPEHTTENKYFSNGTKLANFLDSINAGVQL